MSSPGPYQPAQVFGAPAVLDGGRKLAVGGHYHLYFLDLDAEGRPGVSRLEYEAYEPLAVKALQRIIDEAREPWPGARLAVHHRVGRIELSEASIIIVAASAHRADAFAACRYAIERVKQIVPIWKHEHFEGGDVWLEGATADPEDEAAREAARRLACT